MALWNSHPRVYLPIEDKGVLFADVQLPDGASLQRTEAVVSRMVDMTREIDGVADVISVSGVSLIAGSASNVALVIAILDSWEERTTRELAWYSILGKLNHLP